jgi:hypothetical protein
MRVLMEFGGLHVGRTGAGVERARSDVRLEPALAVGERARFDGRFAELGGKEVLPLGEVVGGNAFLGVAATGEVYLLGDEVLARWPSFGMALRSLLSGTRPADV